MIQPVLTILSISILGILALLNLDGLLSMSANAALLSHGERFCFETGPEFEDISCYKGPANCQKAEDEFIANGGTVFGSCHNAFKHVKP